MIGLLGSMNFAGWMCSSLFIPRMGDIYGRKWPFISSLFVAALTYVGIIMSTDIRLTIGLMFIYGACCAGRYSTCYVYLSELMPANYRTLTCSATQFIEASNLIWLTLYFRFVTKNWLPFQIFGATMTFVCCIASLFIPESSDYLYSKGRYEEARDILNKIGRINRRFKNV